MGIFSKCGLTLLACLIASEVAFVRLAIAEEATTPTTQLTEDQVVRQVAEVMWSAIDVVQQHHISPPSRKSLLGAVVKPIPSAKDLQQGSNYSEHTPREQFIADFIENWGQVPQAKVPSVAEFLRMTADVIPEQIRIVPAHEYNVETQMQNNRYVGIGVTLGRRDDSRIKFMQILAGGAADRAGLINDETVLEVDGRDTLNVPVDHVLTNWLRGAQGTQVTLKLAPNGRLPQREVTLTRSVIRVDSVLGFDGSSVSRSQLRENHTEPICYLRVGTSASTLQELRDAEIRLRAAGMKVLIMDFRSPRRSGDFHLARLLADGLLDGGTMWTWQDRTGERHVETADRECLFRGIPLVVIVDSDVDATAAHVAAALQDAGRATIVGEAPTAGGVIVNAFPICDGQYYVMLESAKLFRSRADRTWPLCPDEQVAMSIEAIAASTVKMNAFFIQRGVEPESQSVSALFPTNMTLKESVIRLVPGSMIPGLPRPMGQQADQAARKVALRLLKQIDERQLEAAN